MINTSGQRETIIEDESTRRVTMEINPFTRVYLNVFKQKKFRPFVEASVSFLKLNQRSKYRLRLAKNSTYIVTYILTTGVDIMLNNRCALEIGLRGELYKRHSSSWAPVTRSKVGLQLGFQYFLTRN